jgi:hypothetical protein
MCFSILHRYALSNSLFTRPLNWGRHKNVKRWEKALLELAELTWFKLFMNSMDSSAISLELSCTYVLFHYRRILVQFLGCMHCVLITFNRLVMSMLICVYGCKDEAALKGRIILSVRIALNVVLLWQAQSAGLTRMSKDMFSVSKHFFFWGRHLFSHHNNQWILCLQQMVFALWQT